MNIEETSLPGVVLLTPTVHRDDRGYFLESWSRERYRQAGLGEPFVQDNLSYSGRNVLRGLHFQRDPFAQGKLITVLRGEVYDVVVDVRSSSPRFGEWVGVRLSDRDHRQLYVPSGFAHGFVVLADQTLVFYKCTASYEPDAEVTIRWDDPDIGVEWPVDEPILSEKDAEGVRLRDVSQGRFPGCETGG